MKLIYQCSKCGCKNQKLWRQYQTIASAIELMCVGCSLTDQRKSTSKDYFFEGTSDQIGWMVPAVPTVLPDADGNVPEGETFWGYSSVPEESVKWWNELRPKIPRQFYRERRDY